MHKIRFHPIFLEYSKFIILKKIAIYSSIPQKFHINTLQQKPL